MVLLVAGVVGGAVIHAQTPSATAPPAANPDKAFADKVAGILGVDAAKVESAFTQAQKELQSDALKTRLDNLVKAGKITQDQADQYQKWWESRPDVQIGPMMGGPGGHMGPMMGGGFDKGFRGPPEFGNPPASPTAPPTNSGS